MDKETFVKAAELHSKLEDLVYLQRVTTLNKYLSIPPGFVRAFPEVCGLLEEESAAKIKQVIASKIAEVESEIEKL